MANQEEKDRMYLEAMGNGAKKGANEYDYLRDNAASEVLNQQIQLANSKEQATRALNQQIASTGMAGSGYAANRQNAIDEAYIKGMQMAQANYGNQLNLIDQQEMKGNAEANAYRAEDLVNKFVNAEDASLFPTYLDQMGLSVDEYGNIANTGNKYNFTEDQLRDFQNAYSAKTGYSSLEEALGSKYNIMNLFANANDILSISEEAKAGKLKNNTAFNFGDGGYAVYTNGRFLPITKEQFNAFKGEKKTY